MVKTTSKRPGRPKGTAVFTVKDGKTRVAAEGFRRVAFFVPITLASRLKALAALENTPVSDLLIRLIEERLRKAKAQI